MIDGIRFLRAVNSGEAVSTGKNVAVVGGGNTAVDCARTAKRVGGESVTLIYRRTRDEMPAADEEVEALLHEGVEIQFLTTPVRFHGKNGKLSSVECIRMELGDADESGRRRPVPVKGSESRLPVDTVITALGQATQISFSSGIGVSTGKSDTITVDPATGATNVEGIFAGGDVTTGPAYVVDAIAAGKKAARSIGKYLKGEPVTADNDNKKPEQLSEAELDVLSKKVAEARGY